MVSGGASFGSHLKERYILKELTGILHTCFSNLKKKKKREDISMENSSLFLILKSGMKRDFQVLCPAPSAPGRVSDLTAAGGLVIDFFPSFP